MASAQPDPLLPPGGGAPAAPDARLADLIIRELDRRLPAGAGRTLAGGAPAAPAGPDGLLRPLLLVRSALATGGSLARVLPAAVGLEYVHSGGARHPSADGDRADRAVPGAPGPRTAIHDRLGSATAVVLATTPFHTWFEALSECAARGVPEDRIILACRIHAAAARAVRAGTAGERGRTGPPDAAGWLDAARLITAAPFAAACRIGATLAGAPAEGAAALAVYGEHLGMALRIQYVLRPFTLSPHGDGNGHRAQDPGDHRIARTLPVLLAHDLADPAQRLALDGALAAAPGPGPARAIHALVVETGGHLAAAGLGRRHAIRAAGALTALPDNAHRRRLLALVPAPAGPGPFQ
ncbi:polyprenyl synthetase family protein [Streptomyces yaizuensis]|uniref:Polyprenyl synthetase family protein n=1 Tax=Streptomyces yaizuensis TaxID=2989713 RepID=A0ABQ5NR77_9ACTN|nr:dimethylallyltranstransferase [Streptomyces sp. YSPA8]GLF92660.1 polyprenyl synthetase family protein [Streptomyces sp. YSPA8]